MSRRRPNIVFIMSDDHARHAMTCYGSRVNETPNLDRIASEGIRLDTCLCTNSICAPSRATILAGTYSHVNGVRTLCDRFDGRQETFVTHLHDAGYQTAVIGKWHLGHGGQADPVGFDYWNVLPGQGLYHDPDFIEIGEPRKYAGYVTDLITDMSIDWLRARDRDRPFCLLCHHKAPHRRWNPDEKHMHLYADIDIPEPPTLFDDYSHRAEAARAATMTIARHLDPEDLKAEPPPGLQGDDLTRWSYQRYMKDYLRCVASIDDNTGRLLDALDEEGLAEDTLVVYTSDQGFFLGDHGWYDKRFMYEESLAMPFVARLPGVIEPGTSCDAIALNNDFAPTFLELAGLPVPGAMQGRSLLPILRGERPADWRESMYYRYFMHLADHGVYAHYGVRTGRYKLIFYYALALGCTGAIDDARKAEWELFDLERDPMELRSVHDEPAYAGVVEALRAELYRLQAEVGDEPAPNDTTAPR
jgi:arylsulfatase A-like enzyme